MSGSLAVLWGLINSLQIVAHFPLLVIIYPENAQIYSGILLELARFDLIPYDLLVEPTEELLGIQENEEQDAYIQE